MKGARALRGSDDVDSHTFMRSCHGPVNYRVKMAGLLNVPFHPLGRVCFSNTY